MIFLSMFVTLPEQNTPLLSQANYCKSLVRVLHSDTTLVVGLLELSPELRSQLQQQPSRFAS
jgi:hypothetical protein